VLITLILAAGVANINLAVANVALPDIGKAFTASQTALDLVAVGYSLGLAASVLYLGAIGDRYGRKLLLVLGMALSVPACLLAAYAPSTAVLVAARLVGGLTAGMAYPSTQNQLEKSFSGATAVAHQYPQYASAITAGARTSFMHGANWAYAAGVITTVVGIALVFSLFPRKDNEQQLLGEYHQADSTQVKASPAARVRGQSSPAG
jgi:MFS family permease